MAEDYRQCEHVEYCRDIIKYIQVLATLIERRFISLEEILAMVRNVMRQHSIDRRGRFEYAFNGFGKSPP